MRRVALLLYVLAAGCHRGGGWMVHVVAFSGDDPWNAGHH